MKCSEFEKLEMKYMDGNITPDEKTKMLEHTSKCPHCSEEMELYSQMLINFEQLPIPVPHEDFTENVIKAAAAIPHPNHGLLFLVVLSIISAVSSFAGFLNLVIINRTELVDTLSDSSALMPFVRLINLLAAADAAIGELFSSIPVIFDIYKENLTFGALAAAIIVLGIYTALKKSVIGGIKNE